MFSLVNIVFFYFYTFHKNESFHSEAIFMSVFVGISPFFFFILGILTDRQGILTILGMSTQYTDPQVMNEIVLSEYFSKFYYILIMLAPIVKTTKRQN
jgi:hypothetical protein